RALLAAEVSQRARFAHGVDAEGTILRLEDQDRRLWDTDLVDEGNRVLAQAIAAAQPGPYQLEAVIAADHANARTAADTDWSTIATAYGQLEAITGSPVVRLNQA